MTFVGPAGESLLIKRNMKVPDDLSTSRFISSNFVKTLWPGNPNVKCHIHTIQTRAQNREKEETKPPDKTLGFPYISSD
jgi:hypothetical protein